MQYVFMNNYRGFTETLVPLSQMTFLVGENSTGKSSFLNLVHVLSLDKFWTDPAQTFREEAGMASFDDIVSASAVDRRYFCVGNLSIPELGSSQSLRANLVTFKQSKGAPAPSKLLLVRNNHIILLILQNKHIKYKIEETKNLSLTGASPRDIAINLFNYQNENIKGFTNLSDVSANIIPLNFLPIFVSIAENKKKKKQNIPFEEVLIETSPVVWIAPIRSHPERFYDGLNRKFSPEGQHTPFLLRRSITTRSTSNLFTQKLKEFGSASGLFESVITHSFGANPRAPFEVLIKFPKMALNINNVGYGVSQVLPLVVEFLSAQKETRFSVQQPEVHLHPRAQAALGDLLYATIMDKNHHFIVETHSDFLIDRYRHAMSVGTLKPNSQVIYFHNDEYGNQITQIKILKNGIYGDRQPQEFRSFFINESLRLLDL